MRKKPAKPDRVWLRLQVPRRVHKRIVIAAAYAELTIPQMVERVLDKHLPKR